MAMTIGHEPEERHWWEGQDRCRLRSAHRHSRSASPLRPQPPPDPWPAAGPDVRRTGPPAVPAGLAVDDPVTALWCLDLASGEERLLADPRALLDGAPEVIPPAERRRRERMRESARGIVAYSADAAGTVVVFALSGRLFA